MLGTRFFSKWSNLRQIRWGAGASAFIALAAAASGCGGDADQGATSNEGVTGEAANELFYSPPSASVMQGKYWHYSFQKTAGWRYTICIDVTQGDADLYGHYTDYPTTANWQFRSQHLNTISDCFVFTASSSGTYYISVYGYKPGTSDFRLRQTSNDNTYVPAYLSGQLKRPNACTTPIDLYGPFNSPWGNPAFDPFYNNYKNYIHNGVDYACAPTTSVKAVCTGPVKLAPDAQGNGADMGSTSYNGSNYWWGKYVVQECTIGAQKVTIAYDHLNKAGLPAVGTTLTKGVTVVGTVVDLTLPGEADHLHLGVCAGAFSSCTGLQGGASPDTAFPPSLFLNADAPGLWGP